MQSGPSCLTDPVIDKTKPSSTFLEGKVQEMKAQFNKYQKNLKDDFNMYEDKVDGMHGLQKEMENQMELHKSVENLKALLLEEKKKCSLHMIQAQQLQQQIESVTEQNKILKQSKEKAAIANKRQDEEDLTSKIQGLIRDEAQKQVKIVEERLHQEFATILENVSLQHKAELEHLEQEQKQKLERIVALCKEKIKQVIWKSEQRDAELRQHLTNQHQEELPAVQEELLAVQEERLAIQEELLAVQENTVSLLDAERKTWMEEKETLMKQSEMREENHQEQIKHLWSMIHRYKAQSFLISRESTPDSEATASSQATSTVDNQNGLQKHLLRLFNKVLQERIDVLMLTECQQLHDHLVSDGGSGMGDVSVQSKDLVAQGKGSDTRANQNFEQFSIYGVGIKLDDVTSRVC